MEAGHLPLHLGRSQDPSSRLRIGPPDLPKGPPYTLKPGRPTPGRYSLLRHPIAVTTGTGNINLFSIDYASRPRLRHRLTLRRLALRRNPWVFGVRVFHPHYRYSCQHSHFRYLQHTFSMHLRRPTERSSTATLARDPQLRYYA